MDAPRSLLLERADVRDQVVDVLVAEVAPGRHRRVSAIGAGAVLDHQMEIGVLARLAVLVRVELEVALLEVARRRRERGAGRAVARARGAVTGEAERVEVLLARGGVAGRERGGSEQQGEPEDEDRTEHGRRFSCAAEGRPANWTARVGAYSGPATRRQARGGAPLTASARRSRGAARAASARRSPS